MKDRITISITSELKEWAEKLAREKSVTLGRKVSVSEIVTKALEQERENG